MKMYKKIVLAVLETQSQTTLSPLLVAPASTEWMKASVLFGSRPSSCPAADWQIGSNKLLHPQNDNSEKANEGGFV